MKRIIGAVRAQRSDIFIAYRSCGSMVPVIGDLAEIGVDVLNLIQESAAGMNQMAVKNAYGNPLP